MFKNLLHSIVNCAKLKSEHTSRRKGMQSEFNSWRRNHPGGEDLGFTLDGVSYSLMNIWNGLKLERYFIARN